MSKIVEPKKCVICGEMFLEYGNNPWPVTDIGQCCDKCNDLVVIPLRLARAYGFGDRNLGGELNGRTNRTN